MSDSPPTELAPSPVLRWALAGSLLLWLAQPPTGWWMLAWIAPIPWLLIARSPEPLGRGGYGKIWLAGFVYWLMAVHWVRLPHPLTPIGWFFLSAYLGCYLPVFVWLVRRAVHHQRVPLRIAAPIAWTGLEFLQANLFSGFLMGAVSHSQSHQAWLRPIAAWIGAYGVSFAVMLAAASIVFLGNKSEARALKITALSTCLLFFVAVVSWNNDLADGAAKLAATAASLKSESVTVAVIQGDTRATWDPAPDRSRKIMDRQVALSLEAVARAESEGKRIDLIVWPESMFRAPLITFAGSIDLPPGVPEGNRGANDNTREWFQKLAKSLGAPLLIGLDRFDYPTAPDPELPIDDQPWPDVYNSAALIDAQGELLSTYDKTHLVPFGEYIPLAKGVPALYYLTPMSGGMASGEGPVAMQLPLVDREPLTISPSICFETVVPHVIRRQVAELTERGAPPDLLVNVTNDAWFWGSSELDMHLACAVYRAVETGTPLVVAANGGLSAVIDSDGAILAQGPRMEEHVLIAEVPLRSSGSPTGYVLRGDWFAGGCLAASGVVAMLAAVGWFRQRGS